MNSIYLRVVMIVLVSLLAILLCSKKNIMISLLESIHSQLLFLGRTLMIVVVTLTTISSNIWHSYLLEIQWLYSKMILIIITIILVLRTLIAPIGTMYVSSLSLTSMLMIWLGGYYI